MYCLIIIHFNNNNIINNNLLKNKSEYRLSVEGEVTCSNPKVIHSTSNSDWSLREYLLEVRDPTTAVMWSEALDQRYQGQMFESRLGINIRGFLISIALI